MGALDDRLRHLITVVEQSVLELEEKQEVYDMLRLGLHVTVLPVIAKYVPKETLNALKAKGKQVTALEYMSMVGDTIRDGDALSEMETLMHTVVDAVEDVLRKEHIIH